MNEERKPTSKFYRNLGIFLGVSFVLALALPYLYLRFAPTDFEALNAASWKTYRLGVPYINVELPVELKNNSRAPSWKEQEFFQYQQTFSYEDGRDFMLSASIVNFNRHVYIDPNAVEQSVQAYSQLYGAKDITFKTTAVTIGEVVGKRLDGTMTIGSRKLAFTRFSVEHRYVVRDFLIVVKAGDAEAAKLRDRIIGSLQLDNNF